MFTMREHPNWTFFALIVILLQTISIYMAAALVLPDIIGEEFVDLFRTPKLVLRRAARQRGIQLLQDFSASGASA
jgi:hypothetical protein